MVYYLSAIQDVFVAKNLLSSKIAFYQQLQYTVAGIFSHIRPVWIGELETRPKTSKN
jgi:hypothetical protein